MSQCDDLLQAARDQERGCVGKARKMLADFGVEPTAIKYAGRGWDGVPSVHAVVCDVGLEIRVEHSSTYVWEPFVATHKESFVARMAPLIKQARERRSRRFFRPRLDMPAVGVRWRPSEGAKP